MAQVLRVGDKYVRFNSKPESFYSFQNELTEDLSEARLYHRQQDVTKAINAINHMRSNKWDALPWPRPTVVDVKVVVI